MPTWSQVASLLEQVEGDLREELQDEVLPATLPPLLQGWLAPLGERPPPPWPPGRAETSDVYWWHGGAEASEVVGFDVSPLYPGDGRGVTHLATDDLRRHSAQANAWLKARRTPWLLNYAFKLLEEMNRRGGMDG